LAAPTIALTKSRDGPLDIELCSLIGNALSFDTHLEFTVPLD
jgi:hypothetical protein